MHEASVVLRARKEACKASLREVMIAGYTQEAQSDYFLKRMNLSAERVYYMLRGVTEAIADPDTISPGKPHSKNLHEKMGLYHEVYYADDTTSFERVFFHTFGRNELAAALGIDPKQQANNNTLTNKMKDVCDPTNFKTHVQDIAKILSKVRDTVEENSNDPRTAIFKRHDDKDKKFDLGKCIDVALSSAATQIDAKTRHLGASIFADTNDVGMRPFLNSTDDASQEVDVSGWKVRVCYAHPWDRRVESWAGDNKEELERANAGTVQFFNKKIAPTACKYVHVEATGHGFHHVMYVVPNPGEKGVLMRPFVCEANGGAADADFRSWNWNVAPYEPYAVDKYGLVVGANSPRLSETEMMQEVAALAFRDHFKTSAKTGIDWNAVSGITKQFEQSRRTNQAMQDILQYARVYYSVEADRTGPWVAMFLQYQKTIFGVCAYYPPPFVVHEGSGDAYRIVYQITKSTEPKAVRRIRAQGRLILNQTTRALQKASEAGMPRSMFELVIRESSQAQERRLSMRRSRTSRKGVWEAVSTAGEESVLFRVQPASNAGANKKAKKSGMWTIVRGEAGNDVLFTAQNNQMGFTGMQWRSQTPGATAKIEERASKATPGSAALQSQAHAGHSHAMLADMARSIQDIRRAINLAALDVPGL